MRMYTRSILKPVIALENQEGMPELIAGVVARSAGMVCATCGLERMGHGPESRWLGYPRHDWQGALATDDEIIRARELTGIAYGLRRD